MISSLVERYRNSIRFRFAYYGLVNIAAITSLVIGACLQMFSNTIGSESEELSSRAKAIMLIATPMLFWIGAVLCDELADLLFDSIDDPPLSNFRSLTAAAFAGGSKRCTDLVMIAIFETTPILSALVITFTLRERWTFTNCLVNYVIGALCCNIGAVVLQIICTVLMNTVKNMRENYIKLTDSEVVYNPGIHDSEEPSDYFQVFATKRSALAIRKMEVSTSHPLYSFLLVGLVFVMLYIAATLFNAYDKVCMVALLLGVVGLTIATGLLVPRFLGLTYYMMVVLFAVLVFNVLVLDSTGVLERALLVERPVSPLVPAPNGTEYTLQSTTDVYPVCLMRWGNMGVTKVELKLNAVDLAGFSYAVYFPHHVNSLLANLTQNTALEGTQLEHIEGLDTVGGWAIFKIPQSKVVVFAVRGMATHDDALAGMEIVSNVWVMQLANKFVPILQLLPTELIQRLVSLLMFRKYFGAPHPWEKIINAAIVAKKNAAAEGYEMVITGHSLGGVFAAMVGAATSSPTLTFSPPGEKYNLDRFEISAENFMRNVVVVQPAYDPIPRQDVQLGLRQNILCNIVSPVECHLLQRTQCELVRTCGDPRGRKPNMAEPKCAGAITGA